MMSRRISRSRGKSLSASRVSMFPAPPRVGTLHTRVLSHATRKGSGSQAGNWSQTIDLADFGGLWQSRGCGLQWVASEPPGNPPIRVWEADPPLWPPFGRGARGRGRGGGLRAPRPKLGQRGGSAPQALSSSHYGYMSLRRPMWTSEGRWLDGLPGPIRGVGVRPARPAGLDGREWAPGRQIPDEASLSPALGPGRGARGGRLSGLRSGSGRWRGLLAPRVR